MIRTRFRRLAFWPVVALLCAAGAAAFAQDGGFGDGSDDDVKAEIGDVTVSSQMVVPGSSTTIHIPLEIDEGWHLYGLEEVDSMPPSIDVPQWPEGLSPGATTESPEPHDFESFGVVQKVHEGEITISLVVNVAADAKAGARTISGEIGFQACNDSSCVPQMPLPFSVDVYVTRDASFPDASAPAFDELTKVVLVGPSIAPAEVAPGSIVEVHLPLRIEAGWHLYAQSKTESFPPTVNIDAWPEGLSRFGLLATPEPVEIEYFGEIVPVHHDEVTLILAVQVAPDAAGGVRTIAGDITMQACDDSSCVPQEPIEFAFQLAITGDGAGGGGAAPAPVATVEAPVERKSTFSGLDWALVLQAMTLGLITVLTPCVFPLLPVTVSFFSKQKGPALPRSLVYASGIIFTIVVIGLIVQQSLDVLARGDIFNLFIAGLFLVLSLSLFGLFDLRLPSFLIDGATKQSASGGYKGAFFMAVVLALTSFSCSLPFLGIMFTTFDEGATGTAVIGLTIYGATMAAPFFVCSLIPALISTLPKAGAWMNAIKVTMGFVEFGLAFKFLRTVALNHQWDILPRGLVIAIWVACCFGAALYLFGYVVLPHDTKVESIGVFRLLSALFFLSCGLYLVPGVIGLRLNPMLDGFLQTQPDELISFGGGDSEHPTWVRDDWDGTLERAARSKRLALFDFTGVG